jgi:hypothetical protein
MDAFAPVQGQTLILSCNLLQRNYFSAASIELDREPGDALAEEAATGRSEPDEDGLNPRVPKRVGAHS